LQIAAYRAEPPILLRMEAGGFTDRPGTPEPRIEVPLDAWPLDDAPTLTWYAQAGGTLTEEASDDPTSSAFAFDEVAPGLNFFGPKGYQLMPPLWDIDWTPFAPNHRVTYDTPPFKTDDVLVGPALATVWVNSPVDQVQLQVTLTELRTDGEEVLVQSGWLDLRHRHVDAQRGLRLERYFTAATEAPVPTDTWTEAKISIPSFAHPVREGSVLRLTVSTPGRDHGTWAFDTTDYDTPPTFLIGEGGNHATVLQVGTLDGVDVPESYPACPGLRGQPCRPYGEPK